MINAKPAIFCLFISFILAIFALLLALPGCTMTPNEKANLEKTTAQAESYYNGKYGEKAKVSEKEYVKGYGLFAYNTEDMIFTMSDGTKIYYCADTQTLSDNRQAKEITQAIYTEKWLPMLVRLESTAGVTLRISSEYESPDDVPLTKDNQVLFNYIGSNYNGIYSSFFSEKFNGNVDSFIAAEPIRLNGAMLTISVYDADSKHDGSWLAHHAEESDWYAAAQAFASEIFNWSLKDGTGAGSGNVEIEMIAEFMDDITTYPADDGVPQVEHRNSYIGSCRISDNITWKLYAYSPLNDEVEYVAPYLEDNTTTPGVTLETLTSQTFEHIKANAKSDFMNSGENTFEGKDNDWEKLERVLFPSKARICQFKFSDQMRQSEDDRWDGVSNSISLYLRAQKPLQNAYYVISDDDWQPHRVGLSDSPASIYFNASYEDTILVLPLSEASLMDSAIEAYEARVDEYANQYSRKSTAANNANTEH